MNMEIMALARGWKCGSLEAMPRGKFSPGLDGPSAASSPSRKSISDSATPPIPPAN